MVPMCVGADPEFFVHRNGHYISGHIFEFGSKEEPLKGNSGYFQNDGLALELNTEPAFSEDGFAINFSLAKSELIGRLKEMDSACNLASAPAVHFSKEYMASLPEKVKELGCREDYDAWAEAVNEVPNGNVHFRTGSGHIHLGWTQKVNIKKDINHFETCCEIVRELDYWVGLPSLLWDSDNMRRSLYGKAGAFRPKPYGLEYRTLSNAWTRTDALTRQVYRQVRKGWYHWCQYIENGSEAKPLLQQEYGKFAQAAINGGGRTWSDVHPELFDLICGSH